MQTIWIHQTRPRTAWYELDHDARAALRARWAGLDEAAQAEGAERVGAYSIRGQSDYSTVEIWRFADPEDSFAFWSGRVAADYSTWFTSSNQLGTPLDATSARRAD